MINKGHMLFWFKTGSEISPDDRVYYNVSLRNGNNLISSYDYWHSQYEKFIRKINRLWPINKIIGFGI
jgi:hypothetical protein